MARGGKAVQNHRNDAFSAKTKPGACIIACCRGYGISSLEPRFAVEFCRGFEGTVTTVSILQALVRSGARSTAFAAGVCVMAVVADASHIAAAQARLEAEYTATLSGIPIGSGNWIIDISEDQFSAAASGGTSGILRWFSHGQGSSSAQGTVAAGQPMPTSYESTITNQERVDNVRMSFAAGNVKDFSVEPPVGPSNDRIPVSDGDRLNVFDPMTSVLDAVGGNGDPVSPQACGRKVSVFDGRMRFDLQSEFKRIEVVKAEKGYHGPAVVCAVYFVPISGYVPTRYAIKYLAGLRDAEVWLAPITGTRVLVPFRFFLPTPVGPGVVQATRFIAVAKPPVAAATVKSQ
jgi:hypothetical protein